ncbi:NAD(P)/FAD-dependent oxidoreductase [Homoserinibacter sp. YIM 151385]|uniref:NAD(P)/FAD-dependent oxidoreductase n=1 Tax=Homoserinibacter sp. YIM 151385 TaxID=2985506 RepID=UPI0022EFEF63|nr:FAD-binding oxidoreductase [Homoserinibacter sp. YIM 151385]WBU36940.1 FAD-binding oxidoreductase [Homoserinibacter sp. YIM 151385]
MARGTTVYERYPAPAAAIEHALEGTRQSAFWLDSLPDRPAHPPLRGDARADLVVVGGGYTGLWTAVRAKERDPGRRVVLLEAKRIAWAASGRNGGFVEASLTHGEENGRRRWPEELEELDELGRENLEGMQATIERHGLDVEWERTGSLEVAVEPHQLDWLEGEEPVGDDPAAWPEVVRLDAARLRQQVDSPAYLGATWHRRTTALVHPAKLALELARLAAALGVEIHEGSRVLRLETRGRGAVEVRTDAGRILADRVALATNVFPSLLRRDRLMTVPVYDYVLMTEPLSRRQLDAIGWAGRQGIGDLANQFHYSRRTADDRILYGGYDAVYHAGGRVRAEHERRPESFRRLASHFLTTYPQLEGVRFTHRWAGAIDTSTRFCAFFTTARHGRVASAAGFTGLGVGAARFAADTVLDLLGGEPTHRTELRMVRERPLPFPPEPAASLGINATRWSLDEADHRGGRRNILLTTLDALGLGFDS